MLPPVQKPSKVKLLDRVREVTRLKHYSIRTERVKASRVARDFAHAPRHWS